MEIIEGTALSNLCDYSFGDHLGGSNLENSVYTHGGFMKEANQDNREFHEKCKEFEGKVMTLFIDNIRLYRRPVLTNVGRDTQWVDHLMSRNDLLLICSLLPKNKFIIFTSHEDTPIDIHIEVPTNVLAIYAVNAKYHDYKVLPFPYGVQRKLGPNDFRHEILKQEIGKIIEPTKLLYINCGIERNKERDYLINFQNLPWVTTRFDKNSKYFPYNKYKDFLDELRKHKFMLCPQGHGMDCHRNWESLYMRRVPIMLKHPYFERLMAPWPVLFVNQWSDITPQLLEDSDYLYIQAQTMDLHTLDLKQMVKNCIMRVTHDQVDT